MEELKPVSRHIPQLAPGTPAPLWPDEAALRQEIGTIAPASAGGASRRAPLGPELCELGIMEARERTMQARRLKGQVTSDGAVVVETSGDLPPGEVEVILLYAKASPRVPVIDVNDHPAFGLWANRPEATDSAAYSLQLRRQIENRGDGRA